MADRDTPNNNYAWYNDDNRLAIVRRVESSGTPSGSDAGDFDTFAGTTVTDGIRITGHTHYAKLNSYTPKIESNQPESNQPEDSPKIDNDDLPF